MIRRPPRSTRTDTLFPYTPLFRSVEFARPRLTPAWIIRNLNRRNHVPAMLEPTHHIAAPCLNMEDIEHDPHRRTIDGLRSEEHTSELQSLMRISYAVFCLKKKTHTKQ